MSELGSMFTLEYGQALPAESRSGYGYPVFGSNGEVGRHRNFLISEKGIVVGRKGSVGKVAWSDEPFWPIDTTYWVRCEAEDRRWLYWVLTWLPLGQLDTTTGVPGLNRNDVYSLSADRPRLIERQRIAQVLDTLDTAIHQTEAIIAKLKAVKQGLLHDLLTRGIDANGELRPPQAEAPHLYKESPLGWIPKEWDCVRLMEKLAVLGGKRLPAGHSYADHPTGYKYLRVTDFFEREYLVDELENLHERTFKALERYEIKPEHLYISIAGSLGHVGVHRIDGAAHVRTVLTENATRLVPIIDLNPDYVAAYMNSEMVQNQVTSEKGTGGGVPKLALFRIEQFCLAWPNDAEQNLIAGRVTAVNERISYEVRMLGKLKREKSGLMDDLLTGCVRVTPLLAEAAQQPGSA